MWLWGDSGTGKTATAVALAHELGLELIEVNASDSRNKEAIGSLIGGAVNQGSLFGTGKLILVDEVDGLSLMTNALHGVGIAPVIAQADRVANRIAAKWQASSHSSSGEQT